MHGSGYKQNRRATKILLRHTSSTGSDTPSRFSWLHSQLFWIALAYIGIFIAFFWSVRGGLGHFWDWSFPYFGDQLSTLFTNKSSSWISEDVGGALGYSSDYFVRFILSLFGFLPTELVRYGTLVIVFAAGSFGAYLLARPHTRHWLAFGIGLLATINPAIFYKYTAGHVNYLIAFVIFIYFVYFLLHYYRRDWRSAVIIGLFIAAMGIQIQFFVIGAIFLAVFLAFNRDLVRWHYIVPIVLIPLLVHAVWLANFITGASSAAETSSTAAQVAVKHAASSDFLSVFTFSFSKATLLSKFYAFYELLWHAILFVFLFWLLVQRRRQDTKTIVLLVCMALMMFMATGIYQTINLGPLTALYPMLREVGHFAPVIVLIALVLIARLVQKSGWRWLLVGVVTGALLIVGVKFQYYSQGYSYASVREKFTPFKEFTDKEQGQHRILAYPFFGKYSFNHLPKDEGEGFPLKNNGHDSFATFAKDNFVKNAIAPHQFKDSMQYRLLQSYDVDVLRPYNVKYIFDFSHIYESNYERYVPPTVYNNDVSLIKNDPDFFAKLLAKNPTKLRQVNEHILEIKDPEPHVGSAPNLFSLSEDTDTQQASNFTRTALNASLDYIYEDEPAAKQATELTQLFNNAKDTSIDQEQGTFSQTVDGKGAVYANMSYAALRYTYQDNQLAVTAGTPGDLRLDGQALGAGDEERQILTTTVPAGKQYYLSFRNTVIPLRTGEHTIGIGKAGDTLEVLAATESNLIANSSFEKGLWQKKVGDCNNYDSNGDVAMRASSDASNGSTALELKATRHDACTNTSVELAGNSRYLLQFDYQSPNAQTANFFLSYGSEDNRFAKGFRAITDDKWHTAAQLIQTPDKSGRARLFLYALEQDGSAATVNRYDNLSMLKLESLQQAELPAMEDPYKQIGEASGDTHDFTFEETGYAFKNLLSNASFERGAWQRNVSDCNQYDSRPDIDMAIIKGGSDGDKALELTAGHHDACIKTTANVQEETDYLLTFDYQTKDTQKYGYAVSFDDPQTTVTREQLDSEKGNGWRQATIKVRAPARASVATLYLYAFENTGSSKRATVRYDNVRLVPLPDFSDRFYVVQPPEQELQPPKNITFASSNPTRTDITVAGASGPFFLKLSESYNPKWRLALQDSGTNTFARWLPNKVPAAIGTTVKTNNYGNGWLVDPAAICKDNPSGCTRNSNGSYDLRLVAEFTPQRWFGVAATVSWLTVLGCAAYLLISGGDVTPTYQSLRHKWQQRKRR
jgi:hypothetical protein